MEEIIADDIKKNEIIAAIKKNHKFLRKLTYLGMDSLHGEIDNDITEYVASINSGMFSFKNYVSGKITVLTKKGCEGDEKLQLTINNIINTFVKHNANFSFDEYMLHLKDNLHELTDEQMKAVQIKKRELIFEELKKPYFRKYLGITNENDEKDEDKMKEKLKEFMGRFEFSEDKIYSHDNIKTFFLSERDNKLSCMINKEQRNIEECKFDNIPNYMPEYKAASEQYDKENGKPINPEDIKKKALFLSKFRMGVLGDAKLITDYVKNSMYYIGEAHFSNYAEYFSEKDREYYNKLPNELKFNGDYNKLFIQHLVMKNLIFPIALKMEKMDTLFKKLSDYKKELLQFIENEKNEQINEYSNEDIYAILFYKLIKGDSERLFVFYIIKNKINKSKLRVLEYNIYNSWGHQTYFTESDIPSQFRVQYIELNIVYHLLRSKGNIYFYRIKNTDMILVSKYTLDNIKSKYIEMGVEPKELEKLEELCNRKLTNRNGISLFQWQIKDLSNNPWRIKKGNPQTKQLLPSEEYFKLVSPACKQFKNTIWKESRFFYDKYIKYKNKYLKLKSNIE